MFDYHPDLGEKDARATLAYVADADAALHRAEVAKLGAAAHWADLHAVPGRPTGSVALPGCERRVRLGGAGTPEVAKFCTAELGAQLGISDHAAGRLVAAGLDYVIGSRGCGHAFGRER